jgi:hypothetical protein
MLESSYELEQKMAEVGRYTLVRLTASSNAANISSRQQQQLAHTDIL